MIYLYGADHYHNDEIQYNMIQGLNLNEQDLLGFIGILMKVKVLH